MDLKRKELLQIQTVLNSYQKTLEERHKEFEIRRSCTDEANLFHQMSELEDTIEDLDRLIDKINDLLLEDEKS
jgi:hypothetical protein